MGGGSDPRATDLEVLVQDLVAHGALQFHALALGGAGERAVRQRVGSRCLPSVPQQPALAAELQLAHVAGVQRHAHVGQGVRHASGAVGERGPAHAAEAGVRQVALGVSAHGRRVRGHGGAAGLARHGAPRRLQEDKKKVKPR